MILHQIQAAYRADDDRLLLRISLRTGNGGLEEIRAWMTRRLIKTLWPGIIGALETQVALDRPQVAHASAEIVAMEHQATVTEIRSRGDFDVPFSPKIDHYPFGEQPILVVRTHISTGQNRSLRINFISACSGNFEVVFTPAMLHGLCTLLQNALMPADWGIELRMPGTGTEIWDKRRLLN